MKKLKDSMEEVNSLKIKVDDSSKKVASLNEENYKLKLDNDFSRAEVNNLKKKLKKIDVTAESFYNNDSKTKYYTGLDSHKTLFRLHNSIKSFLFNRNSKLTPFEQLILTFLKLRLNLPFTYLSYR